MKYLSILFLILLTTSCFLEEKSVTPNIEDEIIPLDTLQEVLNDTGIFQVGNEWVYRYSKLFTYISPNGGLYNLEITRTIQITEVVKDSNGIRISFNQLDVGYLRIETENSRIDTSIQRFCDITDTIICSEDHIFTELNSPFLLPKKNSIDTAFEIEDKIYHGFMNKIKQDSISIESDITRNYTVDTSLYLDEIGVISIKKSVPYTTGSAYKNFLSIQLLSFNKTPGTFPLNTLSLYIVDTFAGVPFDSGFFHIGNEWVYEYNHYYSSFGTAKIIRTYEVERMVSITNVLKSEDSLQISFILKETGISTYNGTITEVDTLYKVKCLLSQTLQCKTHHSFISFMPPLHIPSNSSIDTTINLEGELFNGNYNYSIHEYLINEEIDTTVHNSYLYLDDIGLVRYENNSLPNMSSNLSTNLKLIHFNKMPGIFPLIDSNSQL